MNNDKIIKKKLAFIDHSFHKKTKSANFLRDLFNEHFKVDSFWDDSWSGGVEFDISICEDYDYIFYFQVLNKIEDISKIRAKIIWAPMYDGQRLDYLYWKYLSTTNILILAFSESIENQCKKFNIRHLYIKKYIDPDKFTKQIKFEGNNIFFWYRGGLKFNDIKNKLNPNEIDSFVYLSNPDPKYEKEIISNIDIANYKLTVVESKFIPKEDYLEYLYNSNIFIAPRMQEGIGMSFLEALAIGHSIIAYNDSTMNEYIINGYNGYLFDNNTDKINLKINNLILRNNQKNKKINYLKWFEKKNEIIKFIIATDHLSVNKISFFYYKIVFKINYLLRRINTINSIIKIVKSKNNL